MSLLFVVAVLTLDTALLFAVMPGSSCSTVVCAVFFGAAHTHTTTTKLTVAVGWLVVTVAGVVWGMDHCVL